MSIHYECLGEDHIELIEYIWNNSNPYACSAVGVANPECKIHDLTDLQVLGVLTNSNEYLHHEKFNEEFNYDKFRRVCLNERKPYDELDNAEKLMVQSLVTTYQYGVDCLKNGRSDLFEKYYEKLEDYGYLKKCGDGKYEILIDRIPQKVKDQFDG